jgi:hypothetical protein
MDVKTRGLMKWLMERIQPEEEVAIVVALAVAIRGSSPAPTPLEEGGGPLDLVLVWRSLSPSWRLPRETHIRDNGWGLQ